MFGFKRRKAALEIDCSTAIECMADDLLMQKTLGYVATRIIENAALPETVERALTSATFLVETSIRCREYFSMVVEDFSTMGYFMDLIKVNDLKQLDRMHSSIAKIMEPHDLWGRGKLVLGLFEKVEGLDKSKQNLHERLGTDGKLMVESGIAPLYFKSGAAAFEMACKYMSCTLEKGCVLPALVLSARDAIGANDHVVRNPDGMQRALLHVASDDGGFRVIATPIHPKGPQLEAGQLVAWQAVQYSRAAHESVIGDDDVDERFGWLGFILGTLKPEYINESWTVDQKFLPDKFA